MAWSHKRQLFITNWLLSLVSLHNHAMAHVSEMQPCSTWMNDFHNKTINVQNPDTFRWTLLQINYQNELNWNQHGWNYFKFSLKPVNQYYKSTMYTNIFNLSQYVTNWPAFIWIQVLSGKDSMGLNIIVFTFNRNSIRIRMIKYIFK